MPPEERRDKSVQNLHRYKLFVSSLLAFAAVAALLILPPKVFEPEQRVRPARRKAAAGNTQTARSYLQATAALNVRAPSGRDLGRWPA